MLRLASIDLTNTSAQNLIAIYATDVDRDASRRHARPSRRLQFLAGRALLRLQAEKLTGISPREWTIRPNARMQPEIVANGGQTRLQAAIAHSHDRVATALSDGGRSGWIWN